MYTFNCFRENSQKKQHFFPWSVTSLIVLIMNATQCCFSNTLAKKVQKNTRKPVLIFATLGLFVTIHYHASSHLVMVEIFTKKVLEISEFVLKILIMVSLVSLFLSTWKSLEFSFSLVHCFFLRKASYIFFWIDLYFLKYFCYIFCAIMFPVIFASLKHVPLRPLTFVT